MIVVATSGANDCLYCIVAHGAILRIYAQESAGRRPGRGQLPQGGHHDRGRRRCWSSRSRSRCAAVELADADFAALREHGFTDEDIWDIGAIAAFFALSNRMANLIAHAAQRRVLLARTGSARVETARRRKLIAQELLPHTALTPGDASHTAPEPREHAFPAVLRLLLAVVVGAVVGVEAVRRFRVNDELGLLAGRPSIRPASCPRRVDGNAVVLAAVEAEHRRLDFLRRGRSAFSASRRSSVRVQRPVPRDRRLELGIVAQRTSMTCGRPGRNR